MADEMTEEQRVMLADFANISTVMQKRQEQVDELAKKRRAIARQMRDAKVPVSEMAKAAKIGPQAVYKLLSSSGE